MPFDTDWNVELPRMLERQEPENLRLDFKEKRALLPPGRGGGGTDSQKRAEDISKDVTSFINSEGGVLIYGVRETDDPESTGGAPIPVTSLDPARDGYSRDEITKETIESLITANVQPTPEPQLFAVTEIELLDRVFFVVEVSQGQGAAYQAKDLKYYMRFQYGAQPMEHHLIEMVRNRGVAPQLDMVMGLTASWHGSVTLDTFDPSARTEIPIHVGLRNTGRVMADIALLELGIFESHGPSRKPRHMRYAQDRVIRYDIPEGYRNAGFHVEDTMRWYHIPWNPTALHEEYQPLFKTLDPIHIAQVTLNVDAGGQSGIIATWCWRVEAPGMDPREGLMALEYQGRGRLTLRALDSPFTITLPG